MSGPTTILTPFETNVIVGTSAMINAVPANPTRKALIISNNGPNTETVNVTFGAINPGAVSPPNLPSATTGIPIVGGSSFSLFPYASSDISMGAQLNMIASAAATPVSVLEF